MLVALVAGACGGERAEDPPQEETPETGARRPDVLLITVDSLRPDHLGAYGDERVDTPHLDGFLAAATVFENAWTVTPIPAPSLASLLTSRMPRNHGAINAAYDVNDSIPSVAMALKEAGYRTGAFFPNARTDKAGFRRGFDRYECPQADEELAGSEVVRRSLAFLDEGAEPWFCWVHLSDPHAPYAPGPELEAKYLPEGAEPSEYDRYDTWGEQMVRSHDAVERGRALYRGEVEAVDRALGPLLARVAAEPEVLTVFTAGHGEALFDNLQYFGHTSWLHEPVLRIPLAFRLPDGRGAGARNDRAATTLDVAPTLCATLGIAWTSPDGGLDLFSAPVDPQRFLVHETFAPQAFRDKIAVRRGKWKLHRVVAGQEYVRGATATDFRKIFDLAADPEELTVPDPKEAGKQFVLMMGRLDAWRAKQADPADVRRPELEEAMRERIMELGREQGVQVDAF